MTIQYSTQLRNLRLDAIETAINLVVNSPELRIYSGSAPASADAAATGTLLVKIALPSDWMASASGGTKSKSGTWSGTAIASGTAGYFRITENDGTFSSVQGTVGTSGADLIVESTSISNGQAFSVTSFTITSGQA